MPKIPPIKCGLFQFSLTDYHAILGVPIGASPEEIRKRYLKINHILFPDVRDLSTQEEEDLADQLLSQLVNPSYENLVKDEAARQEHLLLLKQIRERIVSQGKPRIKSKVAQQLAEAATSGNLESLYKKYLASIAKKEYKELDKTLQRIALISEFNLVYLGLKKEITQPKKTTVNSGKSAKTTQEKTEINQSEKATEEQTSPQDKLAKYVEPYLRRGQQLINKEDYTKAIMELREALQLDPKNSQAHTLLGLAYVKQSQLGMAKVHINKALQLDPKNKMALEGKQVLAKLIEQGKGTDSGSGNQSNRRGGLFGGLFGKKNN